ncbi:MAG: hypothetical protein KDF65_06025, partial [Anaerolineae bacterium]|nr:hypothetical protein [Anaerolineae bacterium]
MFTVLRYSVFGFLCGLVVCIGLLLARGAALGLAEFRQIFPVAVLIGIPPGVLIGFIDSQFGFARRIFPYQRETKYKLAPCAWCRQTGRNFLWLTCRVCRGHGSNLAPTPHRKCGW